VPFVAAQNKFDKSLWRKSMMIAKTKYEATCPVCTGDGWIEVDYAHPQGHGEGYIRTEIETCDHCNGDGTYEIDDADLDEIDF